MEDSSLDEQRQAIIFVLQKLRRLTLEGYEFGRDEYRYEYYDDNPLGISQHIVQSEWAILEYLKIRGVIGISGGVHDTNPDAPATWIDWLDDGKYQEEIARLSLVDTGVTIIEAGQKPQPEFQPLNLRSYNPETGILYFCGQTIPIIRQKSRAGNIVGEPNEARALRLLFKDVNSMKYGVPLHNLATVRKDHFDKQKRKRTTNVLDAINRKVEEATAIKNLIVRDQERYYLAHPYLETV